MTITTYRARAKTMGNKAPEATDQEIIDALENNNGIVKYAAAEIGYNRTSLHNRISGSKKLKKAKKEAREIYADEVEKRMQNLIEDPSHKDHWKAVRYYAKTQMKHRGFADQYDITTAGEKLSGATININSQGEMPEVED